VVLALGPVGGLADLLDGRQQQADQHADDGDDDQQLDQREAANPVGVDPPHGGTSSYERRPAGRHFPGRGVPSHSVTVPSRPARMSLWPSTSKARPVTSNGALTVNSSPCNR